MQRNICLIKITFIYLFLFNLNLIADQELPYTEGKAIIKVVEVFSDIHTRSEVIFAEPNYLLQQCGINTDDEFAEEMWDLEKIGIKFVFPLKQTGITGMIK